MEKLRMRYPAQAATETRRERNQRLALSRQAAKAPEPQVERLAPVAVLKPNGELVLSFEAFQGGDYGQLCQMLGLRPSKPRANAQKVRKAA